VLQARFVSIGEVDSYHMTPGAQRIIREAYKRSQAAIG
jgi:hypothetical protein